MKGKREAGTASARGHAANPPSPSANAVPPPAPAAAPEVEAGAGGGDRFRDIVERSSDLIYCLDSEGRFTYANPATAALTGYSSEELIGTRLSDLVGDDLKGKVEQFVAEPGTSTGGAEYLEFPIRTRGGDQVWLGQIAQPIVHEGHSVGVQAQARDVTEQRDVREALAASEARLRAVVESLGEGLVVVDVEDRVLYVNPAFERITGYGAGDLIGNRVFDLMSDRGQHPGSSAERLLTPAGADRRELRMRHRAGHWLDIRLIPTPLHDPDGQPFATLVAVSEVTDQKRFERAREETEERFQQLTENIREAFWIYTADLQQPLYVSPAYEEIIGESRERLMAGKTALLDLIHPEDRELVYTVVASEQVAAGGFEVEFRIIRPDGAIRWLHSRGFPVRDPNGEVYRVAGVAEDVTERKEAQAAVERSEASYRSLYNSLTDLVYIQSLDGRFLNVNDAVVEAYGYTREELLGASPELLADQDRVDMVTLRERLRLAAEGQPQRFEFWGRRKDGSSFPKEVVLTRTEYFGQDAIMAVGRDISERKQAEAESERLAALSRENPNPVLECNADGTPVHVNPAAKVIARELGLDSVEELLPDNHRELVEQALERGDGFHNVEVLTAGRIFEWTYRPHPAAHVVHLFASEVTGRRLMEEQLRHDALHDALTDLPNRLLFMERLQHVVHRARRKDDGLFAVLFLDLDRFKVINDSLGHHIGDELLIAIAERLHASVRTEDTVARFGGDEFAILVESIGDVSDATRVAERIHEALAVPLQLEGYELVTSASVGIALGSSADAVPADLLRNADVAMYRAKSAGPGRFEVFDRGMHVAALDRLQLETDLRAALERGELRLQYQPVIEIATGSISGVEALVRWHHPERGRLLPTAFIPLAEETGMIHAVGAWALQEACRQLVAWQSRYGTDAPAAVAVNVSTRQFGQDELLHQVKAALEQSGLAAAALCLEITESAVMENVEGAVRLLQRLKGLGVRICVDDFGTGYSSLSYLHQFPLDEVKIDRSFVGRMVQDEATLQLVRTMITLAHSLGARSVAEGVEAAEQLEMLREIGADFAQGYLFATPLDPEDLEKLFGRGPLP